MLSDLSRIDEWNTILTNAHKYLPKGKKKKLCAISSCSLAPMLIEEDNTDDDPNANFVIPR